MKIERSIRERLKDFIGILGKSSKEEFEKYLAKVQVQ